MLPSKVTPYLLRLAAPLTDSSIVHWNNCQFLFHCEQIDAIDRTPDDTAFGVGTFSWQDLVHSWKAGTGEVMTVENLFRVTFQHFSLVTLAIPVIYKYISKYVSLIWNFVQ